MSWKPGDMNHDGRVDYVDQKIFDTKVEVARKELRDLIMFTRGME